MAPKTIDYLSLDVEGHETAVLRGLSRAARVLSIERPTPEALHPYNAMQAPSPRA